MARNSSAVQINPGPTSVPDDANSNEGIAIDAMDLSVFRNRLPLLRDIDLSIEVGATIAVCGPNGAGKSTLLKCLAGAIQPTRGVLRWFGHRYARAANVRRKIGFVGHECGLYRELTAAENLLFFARVFGIERPIEKVHHMLRDAGLAQVGNRQASQLSQGMRRRLAVARAVLHEPPLILLDEPFVSVDAVGRSWIEDLFAKWRDEGRTVCFASHDACDGRVAVDRIVRLDSGRLSNRELSIDDSGRSLRSA